MSTSTRLVRRGPVVAAVVALLWGAGLGAAQSPPPAAGTVSPAEAAVLARIAGAARERMASPGLSVAIARNGQVAWAAGFGQADVENDVPVRPESVFRIASISKPMAAVAVMQLVERGRVVLDDPIQKYVPAYPSKGEQVVTVRHLLTHTSGIRHYRPGEMESRESYATLAAAIAIFKDDPLLFAPGTRYLYSTYGYNLLAGVVERAAGLSFGEYLRTRIWEPAGMRATSLEQPHEIVPRRVRQYVRGGGTPPLRNAPYADLSIKWAGGGIIASAVDLARFDIALTDGRLLRPETIAEMHAPMRLANGTLTGYGLGWMVFRDEQGRDWVAHSGGATGGTTYLLRDPARRLSVALLTNVGNAGNLRDLALELARAVK
ncbi:MAG: serine hydrolase domain-containing protein [Vicinamibacterales bacterium]|nr:serine hydrolase domain-containing protein [Vicinamibacterales bacterium]